MDLNRFSERIEKSPHYQFFMRHRKIIHTIEGLIIIGILIAIWIYAYQDHEIKEQIAESCGYTTSVYQCVCEKNYVENWKNAQNGDFNLNLSIQEENGT